MVSVYRDLKEKTKVEMAPGQKRKRKETLKKEASTQTNPWNKTNLTEDKFCLINAEDTTFNCYKDNVNISWKEENFTNCEFRVGNLLTTDSNFRVVLVEPNDQDMTTSIQRMYRDKYPELTQTKEDFEVIEHTTRTSSTITKRKVILIRQNG